MPWPDLSLTGPGSRRPILDVSSQSPLPLREQYNDAVTYAVLQLNPNGVGICKPDVRHQGGSTESVSFNLEAFYESGEHGHALRLLTLVGICTDQLGRVGAVDELAMDDG